MLYRMPRFEYFAPADLEETLSLLSRYKEKAKILSGGTDLLVKLKKRQVRAEYVISLKDLPKLDFIRKGRGKNGLRIGAQCTHQSIIDSRLLQGGYRLLADACRKVGTPQVRLMGTIGGNLCNASPSADSAPPLLALESKLNLASMRGERQVPLDAFFKAPFKTVMEDDELLTEIIIPALPDRAGSSYKYLTKITAVDETLVGAAAVVILDDGNGVKDARIALGSVAPTPLRARKAEEKLRGNTVSDKLMMEVAAVAASETSPRSAADYRRKMSAVLVERAIREALAVAQEDRDET